MEAILKYELPEEQSEFVLASRGQDYFNTLWDLDIDARNFLKHGHNFKSADEVLEWLRQFILNTVDLGEANE